MKRSFGSIDISEYENITTKKQKTKPKPKPKTEDINLNNQKNYHLAYDHHFDAHNDMSTELKKHFLPSHHKTNPLLAEIFEISEEIEKNKQENDELENKQENDELEIIDLRTATITLLEIRKKKVDKIIKGITSRHIPAELVDELMFILELFE